MATVSVHLRGLRLRRARARASEAERVLEAELDREALGTERLRVLVLLIFMAAGLLLSVMLTAYFSEEMDGAFGGNLRSFVRWRLVVLLPLIGYLVAQRALLGRFIRQGRKAPAFYRYVTAFVETSCPTVEIVLAASYADPVAALSAVPAFVYPLFVVLSALRLNFRLCVFTGAVAAAEYALVGLFYLGRPAGTQLSPVLTSVPVHLVKALILLALGVVTGMVALQIKKRLLDSFKLAGERNDIVDTFGRHVSPAVVDKLLERGDAVRGEKREVCVMFLDIRNFTAFAENKPPEEVVEYLESLFDFMVEIVSRHRGIVNKFLGDGFMAVFGAPLSDGRDCPNAVAAAREILARVEQETAAGRILPTRVGIGLHAGEAVTGSIGSALRREYTVIGDVVNLAARVEQLNKQFGSRLLVSEVVWEAAREDGPGSALPMGHVPVRGRESPITIYRLA